MDDLSGLCVVVCMGFVHVCFCQTFTGHLLGAGDSVRNRSLCLPVPGPQAVPGGRNCLSKSLSAVSC